MIAPNLGRRYEVTKASMFVMNSDNLVLNSKAVTRAFNALHENLLKSNIADVCAVTV